MLLPRPVTFCVGRSHSSNSDEPQLNISIQPSIIGLLFVLYSRLSSKPDICGFQRHDGDPGRQLDGTRVRQARPTIRLTILLANTHTHSTQYTVHTHRVETFAANQQEDVGRRTSTTNRDALPHTVYIRRSDHTVSRVPVQQRLT